MSFFFHSWRSHSNNKQLILCRCLQWAWPYIKAQLFQLGDLFIKWLYNEHTSLVLWQISNDNGTFNLRGCNKKKMYLRKTSHTYTKNTENVFGDVCLRRKEREWKLRGLKVHLPSMSNVKISVNLNIVMGKQLWMFLIAAFYVKCHVLRNQHLCMLRLLGSKKYFRRIAISKIL